MVDTIVRYVSDHNFIAVLTSSNSSLRSTAVLWNNFEMYWIFCVVSICCCCISPRMFCAILPGLPEWSQCIKRRLTFPYLQTGGYRISFMNEHNNTVSMPINYDTAMAMTSGTTSQFNSTELLCAAEQDPKPYAHKHTRTYVLSAPPITTT